MPELTKFNQVAFSMKKQSAIGTELDDTDIDYSVDLKTPSFLNVNPEFQDNKEAVNAVEFATRQDLMAKNAGFGAEFDWDSKLLGFLLSLLLQSSTPTQPDSDLDPNAWEHAIVPSALADGAASLVTTIMIAQTSDIEDKVPDVAISEVTIAADRNLMITGGAQFVGSGDLLSPGGGYSFPDVVDGSYLWSNQATIELPTGSSIATQLRTLELRVFQDIIMNDFKISTTAADRGIRDRLDFGNRGIELTLGLIVEGGDTERAKLLAGDEMALLWEVLGDVIPGGQGVLRHSLKLEIPKANYETFDLEDQDGRVAVSAVLKVLDDGTTGYPFRFTVQNEEPWYLAAPA